LRASLRDDERLEVALREERRLPCVDRPSGRRAMAAMRSAMGLVASSGRANRRASVN